MYQQQVIEDGFDKITLSKGKKNAEALDVLLPAFKATALPCQSMTGEPLEPPFVPEAACVPTQGKT